MTVVLDLASATELAEVGGKSRNLGVLLRAGFAVPPGFCVSTAAYREVVAERLADLLTELDTTPAGDQRAIERIAGRARSRVERAPIPAELRDELVAAYVAL